MGFVIECGLTGRKSKQIFMGRQSGHSRAREIWAVILVGAALLLMLALLSHDPNDYGHSERTQQVQVRNFIGRGGAVISFYVFQVFGLGGYVLMCVLAGLGMVLLLGHEVRWRSKVGAAALLVVAMCVLFDLMGFPVVTRIKNLPGAGGFVGLFLGDFSQGLVGKAGTAIVFTTVYLVSLIVLVNLQPSYWVMWVAARTRDGWQRFMGRRSMEEELLERERQLRLKERELARETKRLVEEDERSRPVEPVIQDVSVPKKTEVETEKVESAETVGEAVGGTDKPAAKKDSSVGEAEPVKPFARSKTERPKAAAVTTSVASVPDSAVTYRLPTVELLNAVPDAAHRGESVLEDLKQNAEILRATLEEFGIAVDVTNVTKGPVVTLYEVVPAPGVKVEKITALSNNIALAMKAVTVRILAPVPGKGTVGIEVPNPKSAIVYLRDILESDEWRITKARIPIALGRDVAGNIIIGDLSEMPHLLIAGATGSGKTVCVNAILASLLFRFTPHELRLVLVDPKVVEMQHYNKVPHLVVPVVTEAKKVTLALRWCINEMEKRFQILAKAGVRNIAAFNSRPRTQSDTGAALEPRQEVLKIEVARADELVIPDRLPYIVIVIDELADLMQQAGADIENAIARLAALSRAVGIHMVLATQRPSVDVITGVIKANFPARIGFQVASKQDSRVILDANGAEKLLGKGDMLYLPAGSSKLIRAQGVLVQDDEIQRLLDFWEKQGAAQYVAEIHSKLSKKTILPADLSEEDAEDEALVEQAIEVIRQTHRASVSVLQRRLRIGYTRAARIMDLLEERGIVGPGKGAEPRDILIDLDADSGRAAGGESDEDNENAQHR
ncbi:MAG: DNA translocase FtsK [Verrucomicrobiae bacterium]|nr:DNA translocase FtsK [Verrucomicrobiae bacterium]